MPKWPSSSSSFDGHDGHHINSMRCQSEGLPSLKRMRLLATWAVQRQRTFLREIGHRHLLRLRYQASEKRLVKSSSRVRKANWVTLERDRDGRQIDLVRESFLSSSYLVQKPQQTPRSHRVISHPSRVPNLPSDRASLGSTHYTE